jgi:protein-tyrosine phosphatase
MPSVIDCHRAEDMRDVVHRAVQTLVEGRLVAFPTETVYGLAANALDERAVERLLAVKGRAAGNPLALAIKSADEAADYVPDLSPLARRLARRCWPGPITLVVDDAHPESLLRQLPPGVQRAVTPEKTVGLRVPGHEVVLETLRLLSGPLTLTSANLSGQPDSVTATEVIQSLGDLVDLVIDDGPCRFRQPSSVVRVTGNKFRLLRAGVVPERTLHRLASYLIVLVCTGNTCRSPMAEMLCRRMVAERLGCDIDEIEDRGVIVASAGIAAMSGGRAAAEAVAVMQEHGLDLARHETQPLTEPLVRHADVIFTMTRSHREAILAQWPGAAERTAVLAVDGADVCDPIGGPIERYRHCAAQMEQELRIRIEQLEL